MSSRSEASINRLKKAIAFSEFLTIMTPEFGLPENPFETYTHDPGFSTLSTPGHSACTSQSASIKTTHR